MFKTKTGTFSDGHLKDFFRFNNNDKRYLILLFENLKRIRIVKLAHF